jgi:cytochrome o ubiquinol oxidase subunit III
MTQSLTMGRTAHDEHAAHAEMHNKTLFGFWVYLMTDCVLFSVLFATYAVLHNNVYGGPAARELFSLPYALGETMFLLLSSFTCGLAMLAARRSAKTTSLIWFGLTFLLGLGFVVMEVTEFAHLVREGNSWERSGFLTSFFTLVGTHGLHVSLGLLWMLVMMGQVAFRGFTTFTYRRLCCLRLFWHFLDVVWVFLFTMVYLMGAVG